MNKEIAPFGERFFVENDEGDKTLKGNSMRTLRDAVYAVAVGDALGVPVQFRERDTFHVDIMTGYGTDNKPPGTWSDDTSLTLATCMSIKESGGVDISLMRTYFLKWYEKGEFTPFGEAFDVGATTRQALETGVGLTDIRSNGNGSLMRIVPLAFLPRISKKDIEAVSAITHGHRIAKDACIIYVTIAQALLQGATLPEAIHEGMKGNKNPLFEHLPEVGMRKREEIKSTGYVVDTLYASIWSLLQTDNLKDALLTAVNLGDDSDTTAAVTGGLGGILYGCESIPSEWLNKLKRKDIIENCLFS